MKLSDVDVGSPLKSIKNQVSHKLHSSIAFNAYLVYKILMNKFEFKNLVKNLKDSLKEKTFFKDLRKEVNTGANGTQDYVVKKGVNKDTIATTKQ
jgi:patatin-like phospholipase/acyl hydrolase